MAYTARVFRILVASPGDVEEERAIVADVIQEWNYLNSEDTGVVLLPVRWETHSSPELGERPQAVINRQIVDNSDMLIGVFWTRLGTPTGMAASGTVEEIERVGQAGKIVMLYFSRAKVDLDSVDLDEYRRLKDFKEATYPRGLIEAYSSPNDFREKLSRQLATKVRDLRLQDSLAESANISKGTGSLALTFALGDAQQILPNPGSIEVENIICTNEGDIPDYSEEEEALNLFNVRISSLQTNPDYYRESVEYFKHIHLYAPLRIAMQNSADVGVRDIYIDLMLIPEEGQVTIREEEPIAPSTSSFNVSAQILYGALSPEKLSIKFREDHWEVRAEFPVVQAKRTLLSARSFFLGALEPSVVTATGTIYSSNSAPFTVEAKLGVSVRERRLTYQEILSEVNALIQRGKGG